MHEIQRHVNGHESSEVGDVDESETPENDYRRKYFEVIDTVITCIKERFDQEDYVMFATCEQVLLKAVRGQQYEIELGKVCDFYHDDYDKIY